MLEREGHRAVAVDDGKADRLPAADQSFDTVLLGGFLARRVSYSEPIAEALRVLRPGGRLILTGRYGGADEDDGFLLEELIDGLADCTVKEIASVGDEVFFDVLNRPHRNREEAWRRALAIAEQRLEAREDEVREGQESQAAERRELREALNARDRELGEARSCLSQRERELDAAKASLAEQTSRAESGAMERDAELDRLRATVAKREREQRALEARLEKQSERAERFRASLVAIRSGRIYRLSRIVWRLRRVLTRSAPDPVAEGGRDAGEAALPAEAADGAKTVAAEPAPAVEVTATHPKQGRVPDAPLVVATILDEMSEQCFAPECDLVPLGFDRWREQLDGRQPDLLLVESAWNGNGGEWQYRIAKYSRPDLAGLPALRELLDACRDREIPTAFWNKEDPVHFDRFVEAAALFDHVFTTDSRCVDRYNALPGERTVDTLPFAAQPRIHNPAAVVPERSSAPCFAGAWYRDRHPDRRHALEALLDAARPHGLVIYDRRFEAESDEFGFPERFAPHILGRLPYEKVLDVYKSHDVFLNANSVIDSPTMCSRRVFELAACDTAILSTPGAALSELLGEDLIAEAGDEQAAAAELRRLLEDDGERSRRARAARRAVFAEHTYADRLATIAAVAGLNPGRSDPMDLWTLELRPGVTLSENALADLRAAASFVEADVIGVGLNGSGANGNEPRLPEHRRVDRLDPRALLISNALLEERSHPAGSADELEATLREWGADGVRFYAADADLLDASPQSAGTDPRAV